MSLRKEHFFIILVILVCSCSTREPLKIIHDYEVGFTWDGKIRTYYYWRSWEKDTLIIAFVPTVTDGVHYITEYSRSQTRILGERKFRLGEGSKELVEAYQFDYLFGATDTYDTIKLDIRTIKEIPGEKYHGGFFKYKARTKSDIISKYSIEETFLKDTTFTWKNEMVPALKFREQSSYSTFFRYLPFKNTTVESDGFYVFAKGIGMVHMKVFSKEYENSFSLVKVTEEYAAVHTLQRDLLE